MKRSSRRASFQVWPSSSPRSARRWCACSRIIFAAARFPSKNRDKVYAEIRDEFRRNAALEPGSDAAIEQVALAQQSLRQLQAYTNMQRDDGSWELNMESNPMPKPPIANDPN